MSVLVTGGTGFIGSHLVEKLADSDVVVVSKHKIKNPKYYYSDITDKEKLNIIFSKENPENVIHLAAQVNPRMSMKSPLNDMNVNVLGTLNVLEMCRNHGTKKIIFASSAAVYGEPKYLPVDEKHPTLPVSIYGASKLVAEKYTEMYCRAYGMKYTILRYANVYGPGSRSVISIFIGRILSGKVPVIFGNGNQKRDYVYVNDIVSATLAAIRKADGMTLNISTATRSSVKDIYNIVSGQLKTSIKPIYKSKNKGDINNIYLDNSMAKKHIGWTPKTDLATGIAKIIAVMRK